MEFQSQRSAETRESIHRAARLIMGCGMDAMEAIAVVNSGQALPDPEDKFWQEGAIHGEIPDENLQRTRQISDLGQAALRRHLRIA